SFYWNLPNENFSFLGYGEIFSLSESDFKSSPMLEKKFHNLPFKIVSNRSPEIELRHPQFVGGIKFPSGKSEQLWKNFDFAKWFIPKILLLKLNKEYFITINEFYRMDVRRTLCRSRYGPYGEFSEERMTDGNFLSEVELILESGSNSKNISPLKYEEQFSIKFIKPSCNLDQWSSRVEAALQKITDGIAEKIVLARFDEIEFTAAPNILSILKGLEENYGECYTFAYKSEDSIFFGSSPEKLFKISNGFIETVALAGSIQRGISDEEDALLENQLLMSKKNLAEQKNVLDFILERLSPLALKISYDSKPAVKKLSNIQHLCTNIRAELTPAANIFSLLEKLHPTPAVCGLPAEDALKIINELEEFDRGLYSGVVGWFNLQNAGEFAVGIRSAVLNEKTLRAYAGSGIVNGSESLSEFNETELKLKPIISLFVNETVNQS
ncbi:MAG: isochorismate synthase, partial [Bacteroidota bacterium]